MSSFVSSTALFQATFFDAKLGAAPRTVLVRAASFVEAEALAGKLGSHYAGILIEAAPAELPPTRPRTRNGVTFLVPMPQTEHALGQRRGRS